MSDEKALTTKEATAKIAQLLTEIDKLYKEAETLADKYKVPFVVSGPTYGMGGTYIPKATLPEEEHWESSSDCYGYDEGWQSSSC